MTASSMRRSRPLVALALILTAVVAVLFGSGTVAHATPSPGEYEDQIDAKWNQLEPIIEKYNALKSQLADQQKQVDALQAQIQPLKTKVDLAMTRIGAMSALVYQLGPAANLNAILNSGDPTAFVDQLSTLNVIATMQTAGIADAIRLKNCYDEQKKPLDIKVADLKTQTDALNAQSADIKKQIDDLQKLRLAAYGSLSGTGKLARVACPQDIRRWSRDQGRRVRLQAGRQEIRVGRRRAGQLRLLRADPGGLERGRREPAAQRVPAEAGHHPGHQGEPEGRRPDLHVLRRAPRGDLRRQRLGRGRAYLR